MRRIGVIPTGPAKHVSPSFLPVGHLFKALVEVVSLSVVKDGVASRHQHVDLRLDSDTGETVEVAVRLKGVPPEYDVCKSESGASS